MEEKEGSPHSKSSPSTSSPQVKELPVKMEESNSTQDTDMFYSIYSSTIQPQPQSNQTLMPLPPGPLNAEPSSSGNTRNSLFPLFNHTSLGYQQQGPSSPHFTTYTPSAFGSAPQTQSPFHYSQTPFRQLSLNTSPGAMRPTYSKESFDYSSRISTPTLPNLFRPTWKTSNSLSPDIHTTPHPPVISPQSLYMQNPSSEVVTSQGRMEQPISSVSETDKNEVGNLPSTSLLAQSTLEEFSAYNSISSNSQFQPSQNFPTAIPSLPESESEDELQHGLQPRKQHSRERSQSETASTRSLLQGHSSHFGDSIQQKKTLKPNSIYTEDPKPLKINVNLNHPMLNSLLSNSQIPGGIINLKSKALYRDRWCAIIYLGSLLAMYISGIIITVKTSRFSLRDITSNAFFAVKDSLGLLCLNFIMAIISGSVWIYFVKKNISKLLKYSIVVTCTAVVITFVWAIINAIWREGEPVSLWPQIDAMWGLSVISALVGLGILYWYAKNKENFSRTIQILELAGEMLDENWNVFRVSFFLLSCQTLFILTWLIIFAHLFLNGSLVNVNDSETLYFDKHTLYLVIFYVFMLFWTCAIFRNIQRAAMGGITSIWYFHRHQNGDVMSNQDIGDMVLKRAFTTSFGSICYGSVIFAVVRLFRFVIGSLKKYVAGGRFFKRVLVNLLLYTERAIEFINKYAFACVGMTGEGFCASARIATKLFRRNMIFNLLSEIMVQQLFLASAFSVSLFSGLMTYTYALYVIQSQYAYVVGLCGFWISYFVNEFCSQVVSNVTDTICLCYSIDVDTNSCHHTKAHSFLKPQQHPNSISWM